ncbi:glycoside hydrolase family 13 protein [Vallitalea okinawensis]|uniref:glycoside hydrolase family 13 protein n=1 Tax=Vallitalea okinawensis TaxID=2078660 RepID=UPI000CFD9358|nr:alpha-glucosidase [Vallitalea okinawensis]
MDNKWWMDAVIYQIFPRSFKDSNDDGIGDLKGIIEKLDYLKDLGVDALWICPIHPSPNFDSGYDVSDYYDIWDELGSMDDMEKLISEVHKREMRLIMDLVPNHTSHMNKWFVESRKSKDNPYRDFYIWRPGKEGKEPNNWASIRMGGSVWEYDEQTDEYYLHLYSPQQPDLNWNNQKVRRAFYDIMDFWLQKGVDGFRMDVINKIAKEDGLPDVEIVEGDTRQYLPPEKYYLNHPKVHEYLKELNKEVFSKYKDKITIGQVEGVTPEQAYLYTGDNRSEIDLFLQFEHVNLIKTHNQLVEWSLLDFKKLINKWQTALSDQLWNLVFFSSHDLPRLVSSFGNDDKYRVESAKMLATILLTLRGTPIIYQGDEIGMTNPNFNSIDDYQDMRSKKAYLEHLANGHDNEEALKYVQGISRDNSRTPIQWNNSQNAGFTDGKPWININSNYKEVNVVKQLQSEDSILNYYKKLIAIRKNSDILLKGTFRLIHEEDNEIFSFIREYNDKQLMVVANFTEETKEIRTESLGLELLLSSNPVIEKSKEIILKPYEARIYKKND